jgi:hypothetical protein
MKNQQTPRRAGAETFRAAFPQARSLWAAPIPGTRGMTVEAFLLVTTIVLIQDYGDGDGWQAFTPTTDDGRIDSTLDAIAVRAGAARKFDTKE